MFVLGCASRVAGCAPVAYLRLEDTNGNIHIAFVIGKARLPSPLDLTVAVLSVRVFTIIREEFGIWKYRELAI